MENVFRGFLKVTLLILAVISLVIGIIGVLLPLVPGSPFLILSAVCFIGAAAL